MPRNLRDIQEQNRTKMLEAQANRIEPVDITEGVDADILLTKIGEIDARNIEASAVDLDEIGRDAEINTDLVRQQHDQLVQETTVEALTECFKDIGVPEDNPHYKAFLEERAIKREFFKQNGIGFGRVNNGVALPKPTPIKLAQPNDEIDNMLKDAKKIINIGEYTLTVPSNMPEQEVDFVTKQLEKALKNAEKSEKKKVSRKPKK